MLHPTFSQQDTTSISSYFQKSPNPYLKPLVIQTSFKPGTLIAKQIITI